MSDDGRAGILAGVGLAAAVVVCCGLPVLIGSGALATLAGIGLGSWLLIAFGLVVLGGGVVAWAPPEPGVPGRQRSGASGEAMTPADRAQQRQAPRSRRGRAVGRGARVIAE